MHRILIFFLLLSTWLVFSGKLDALHVGLGALSSLLITFSFGDLLFSERTTSARDRAREIIRLPAYLTWLLWQITLANFHVLRLALAPTGPKEINPRIVRFKTNLTSPFARYVFAQSITLTPGTVTVDTTIDGEFIVHAINRATAEGLASTMERRVAYVFEPELLEGGSS